MRRTRATLRLWLVGSLWAPTVWGAAELRHDFYVCATLEESFFIGSKIERSSGISRSPDRVQLEHVGPKHPRIDSLAAVPANPRVFFAAASNGVLRTTDYGHTWRIMTGWDMTEPKCIAVDPHRPTDVYAALPDGIGVSRDAGLTWTRGQQGIRRPYTQTILVDRTQGGRLVAGTELGIYLSEDAAQSWRLVLPTDATVDDVKQSPHDPRVFLAVTQANGAWRSDDGARTWQRVAGIGTRHTLHYCAFDPTDAQRIVVCGWGCGILVSEDGGRHWESRNAGLPNGNIWCVASDPDLPGRLYASPHQSGIFVSDDFGRTWRKHWFESVTVWRFVFVQRPEEKGGSG